MDSAPPFEFVAFDLETTGLVSETDRIVEIGAVRFDLTGKVLDQFSQLVHPERAMSPAAEAIHGISDAMLKDAPSGRDVLPAFLRFLGNFSTTTLLAHNAAFDAGFLGRELDRFQIEAKGLAVVDTLALARARIPEARDHRLDTLARLLNLDLSGAHRALSDSLRVMGVWLKLDGNALSLPQRVSYPVTNRRGAQAIPLGWEELARAIEHSQTVRMEYSGGTRGNSPRDVTPRAFAHRGGIPYLVALCHLDSYEKSFRLDRVTRFQVIPLANDLPDDLTK